MGLLASGPAQARGYEHWNDPPLPTPGPPRIFGGPAAGCISGAVKLPWDGPGYEAIRISRNRYWGHPNTVRFVEALGAAMAAKGYPPLYIGDMGQPRGGPLPSDHASHQNGLDVDVWDSLLPKASLAPAQREDPPLPRLVTPDQTAIEEGNWTPAFIDLLRTAAQFKAVDRIFVHWQIKKRLCQTVTGDRSWLHKVRAWWGHTSHFHVRLSCPSDSQGCVRQAALPANDGCGAELDWWLTVVQKQVKAAPPTPAKAPPPPHPKLPLECTSVLRTQ